MSEMLSNGKRRTQLSGKRIEPVKDNEKRDLIFLYVLLERLADTRKYRCCFPDNLDSNTNSVNSIEKEFKSYFDPEENKPEKKPGYWMSKLTSAELLQAQITSNDRYIDGGYGEVARRMPEQPSYDIAGETLLHYAVRIPVGKDEKDIRKALKGIVNCLTIHCPGLIRFRNRGLTPLQIAVALGNKDYVQDMVEKMDNWNEKHAQNPDNKMTYPKQTANEYSGTMMRVATPLALAAITFNEPIFECLMEHVNGEESLDDKNEDGDNIIHSLIRHAYRQNTPGVQKKVLKWFKYIFERKWADPENDKKAKKKSKSTLEETNTDENGVVREETMLVDEGMTSTTAKTDHRVTLTRSTNLCHTVAQRKLLMMTNNEDLNPLQLAAKLGQYLLFEYILNTSVYRSTEPSKGIVDKELYDITDIETVPIRSPIYTSDAYEVGKKKKKQKDISDEMVGESEGHHKSVLQYVSRHDADVAFKFISFPPMKGVLHHKWSKYQVVCFLWFLLHMGFMFFITENAVNKRSVLREVPAQNGSMSMPKTFEYVYTFANDAEIKAAVICSLIVGTLYLSVQTYRRTKFEVELKTIWYHNTLMHLKNPYSNSIFTICFCIFAVALIIDGFVVISQNPYYEHYLTPFILIIGWYLILFFLQVWQPFSFFTVLIQRVIIDLVKFAVVMSFLLIAFTASMYMIMQGASDMSEDFTNFRRTTIKMLMIMIGLGDLDVLFAARSTVMSITVFVLFVLLTTILLLNALIALMSNTCTELMLSQGNVRATYVHSYLQKLSMILYIESLLNDKVKAMTGVVIPAANRFHRENWVILKRRMWMMKSISRANKIGEDYEEQTQTAPTGKVARQEHKPRRRRYRKVTNQWIQNIFQRD